MTTFEGSPQQTLDLSMPSAADSPARTSATPAAAPASRVPGRDYGASSPDLLASYDPDTSSWRTSQRCLVEGWTAFSETWPRSGLMRSGIAYRLPPLVHLTAGTGFGSLPTHSIPTPTTQDHIERRSTSKEKLNPLTNKSVSLDRWVRFHPIPTPRPCSGKRSSGANRTEIMRALETWPTPRATDGTHGGRVTPRKGREGGNLVEAVSARQTWPTPSARDWRSGKASDATLTRNSRPLNEAVTGGTAGSGALNPTWVEWLMGFPLGWTDLEV